MTERLALCDLTARDTGRRVEMTKRDTTNVLDRNAALETETEKQARASWQRPEMKRKVAVRKVTLFSGSSSTIVSP